MRLLLLSVLLAAATACSRSHAPATAGSALPPASDASVAQSVPAGGTPDAASIAAKAAAGVESAARAEDRSAALTAPRDDSGWVDVAPEAPVAEKDPALAAFEDEQHRRDSELMAQDAAEAERHRDGGGRMASGAERDRYADDRGRRYADPRDPRRSYGDERYAGEQRDYRDERDQRGYGDERDRRDGYYRDEAEYPPPPEYYDPYEQPQPWEEEQSEEPEPGDYYDPRDDDPYRR